ncbi:MAG: hypothetical protein M3485_10065 [Pseudomonadota bacterium]|nr:hypothetical protein [Pseudomonadota bacterium]
MLLALLLVAPLAATAQPAPTGWLEALVFDRYAEAAALDELFPRRFPDPELRLRVEAGYRARLALDASFAFSGHSVDLEREHFDLFVPETQPESGYGLMVFIPPGPRVDLPRAWRAVLNSTGTILVAPRDAGNGQDTELHRSPLALHAWTNVTHRYPVDPQRTYIGGWSGGSRVALRLAVAFPDIFNGAVLIAGSDPVGGPDGTLLPTDELLVYLLRSRTRLVLLTGDADEPNVRRDNATLGSLREAGVAGAETLRVPRLGHRLPGARWMLRALGMLEYNAPQSAEE